MHVLLTGGTGFLGRHIADCLRSAGHTVRVLCRSEDPGLAQMGCQVFRGDILDEQRVKDAMVGIDAVIHAAGLVSRDETDRSLMMRVHIEGTRYVMAAAQAEGVRRVVHMSTSGTLAVSEDAKMVRHEDDGVPLELIARWPYYLSKWLGERAALSAAESPGAPEVVVLNPTLTLGPGDVRGSSTNEIRRFLNRQIPVVPSGGLSFVDVRDVAAVAVAMLTKGQNKERYLLSAVNLTFADFLDRLSQISGVKGPRLSVPLSRGVTRWATRLVEQAAAAVGAEPAVSSLEADMATHFWYCDARKAKDALGFAPRDPMMTLMDTVRDVRGQTRAPL